jgi:hypothetical protein
MLCIQSYGIQYREESDVEIVTYVDFVDPIGHAHKAGLRSGTEHFSFFFKFPRIFATNSNRFAVLPFCQKRCASLVTKFSHDCLNFKTW